MKTKHFDNLQVLFRVNECAHFRFFKLCAMSLLGNGVLLGNAHSAVYALTAIVADIVTNYAEEVPQIAMIAHIILKKW